MSTFGLADANKQYVSSRGQQFQQLFQKIPALRILYTSGEADYDVLPVKEWVATHWVVPITCVTVYLVGIFFGLRIMKDVKGAHKWFPRQLAAWNFLLATFSTIGALRTVPHLLNLIATTSFEDTICTPPDVEWGVGATGLWVQLFILSKIPELWDTFYIVVRQRPLLFLHWYHHVTVLLYCWHSYATEAPQALYFVAMNYSVHAVMYAYYCLKALKIKPPIPDKAITTIQILQMVVGTAIQCSSMYFYSKDEGASCKVDYSNLVAGALMYGSYFCLFFKFAIERYFKKPDGAAKKAKKQA
jgi:elongation of very long chain fatty acids protein 6